MGPVHCCGFCCGYCYADDDALMDNESAPTTPQPEYDKKNSKWCANDSSATERVFVPDGERAELRAWSLLFLIDCIPPPPSWPPSTRSSLTTLKYSCCIIRSTSRLVHKVFRCSVFLSNMTLQKYFHKILLVMCWTFSPLCLRHIISLQQYLYLHSTPEYKVLRFERPVTPAGAPNDTNSYSYVHIIRII